MGRKVNPIGFRLGIIKEHKSRWFATGKQYTDQLSEDRQIRSLVFEALNKEERGGRDSRQSTKNKAGISNIDIERQPNQVHIIIDTARPGVIIGRKGASVNLLRQQLQDLTQKKVKIDVREISKPELDARLVAESVAEQIERRVSWKRAMKQAVQKTMRAGGKGIMITVAGRLGGADMVAANRTHPRQGSLTAELIPGLCPGYLAGAPPSHGEPPAFGEPQFHFPRRQFHFARHQQREDL